MPVPFSGPFSRGTLTQNPALRLSTSIRSFRAEKLSRFVKALLDGDAATGRECFESLRDRYAIVLTRSMRRARRWIRQQRPGTERAGRVASSSAQRLKPHAIDIRVSIDPVHWFLDTASDTRSSLYLEDAATGSKVKGVARYEAGARARLHYRTDGWNRYHPQIPPDSESSKRIRSRSLRPNAASTT